VSDQTNFCTSCGAATSEDGAFCSSCGAALSAAPQASVAEPLAMGQPAESQGAPGTNAKAIWSLALSIIGIIFIGFAAGPLAIWLGTLAKKETAVSGQSGTGLATAGVIVGIIATVLGLVRLIFIAGN
jgi:Domain of unknown function (DUF4190)